MLENSNFVNIRTLKDGTFLVELNSKNSKHIKMMIFLRILF